MAVRLKTAFVASCLAVLAFSPAAQAAFPGGNGKIAFLRLQEPSLANTIETIDPDGSGEQALFNNSFAPAWSADGARVAFIQSQTTQSIQVANADGTGAIQIRQFTGSEHGRNLSWSPDGRKIAFDKFQTSCGGHSCVEFEEGIWVIGTDGSGETQLSADGQDPAWSPDGTQIAFAAGDPAGYVEDIQVMNSDGSGRANLTNSSNFDDRSPNWSPDGGRITFSSDAVDGAVTSGKPEVYVMNANGSAPQNVTSSPLVPDETPAWSPDGTKIVFSSTPSSGHGLFAMNPDGTGLARVTSATYDATPDWQPVPASAGGFPRPKGATPFQTYLTVAYKQCTAPNRQHGAPLAILSCNPPQQASNFLTVGTLDANQQQAKAVGVYRLDVQSSPADVKITFALKDVRNQVVLTDYTGELRVTENLRLTDKNNGPISGGGGTDPATNSDIPFPPLDVTCAVTTADATVGSTCNATSSANAIVPGVVQGGTRMNSELGQVLVEDGGADGVAATTADNTLFMDQGVFIP